MGSLYFHKEFLSKDYYKYLHNFLIKNRNSSALHTPKNWPKKLTQNYKIPRRAFLDREFIKPFISYLEKTGNVEINLIWDVMVYYYYRDAGMNWHDDGIHINSFTFYVNKNWNENWGGEFMYKNDTKNGFIKPTGNSLIILKPPVEHKVNPILEASNVRITLQGFGRKR